MIRRAVRSVAQAIHSTAIAMRGFGCAVLNFCDATEDDDHWGGTSSASPCNSAELLDRLDRCGSFDEMDRSNAAATE